MSTNIMTIDFLLMFYFSLAVVLVKGHDIVLTLSNTFSKRQFELTCEQSGWRTDTQIDWYRTNNLVLKTRWKKQRITFKFVNDGADLKNRTTESNLTTRNSHSISIQIDGRDYNTYWQCCGKYWCSCFIVWECWYYQCSYPVFVDVTTGSTIHEEITPPMPTGKPGFDFSVPLNGTLILNSSMTTVTVDQLMTLSCTINFEIAEEYWIVLWAKNDTPFLITSANSSIINPDNLVYWLPSILNETGNNSYVTESLDLQNLTVSSNASWQNITFQVPPSLIGESLWQCGNVFLRNLSNEVVINVIPQSTTVCTSNTSVTTSTPFVTSQQMDPDTKDPLPVSASDKKDGESSTTTIIAGSVTGAVVVVVVVVVIFALLWRRRNKNQAEKGNYTGNTGPFEEDIVMEENVLYAGSKEKSDYDDERVVQDNILYEGIKDSKEQLNNEKEEAVVMEDNVLYEKGSGVGKWPN